VNHFAPDVDRVKANIMYAVQQPIPLRAYGEKMGPPAWRTLPSWFLVAAQDQVIPPDAERAFAHRMRATTEEVQSSHVIMVSHPDRVASVIEKAVQAVPVTGRRRAK
jgi:pimeloyl-ACP methyl ester carboxylesterase